MEYTQLRAILLNYNMEMELNDYSMNGDFVNSDNAFGILLMKHKLGCYRVLIEPADSVGNRSVEEAVDRYLLHGNLILKYIHFGVTLK